MKNSFQSFYLDSPLVPGRVFDVFEPSPDIPVRDTALFCVHGGGWRAGSRTVYHKCMEILGEKGYFTATPDYRLDAPDAFAQLADVRESFDCFAGMLKEKGHPCRIAVCGSSAGAHLASLLAFALPGECGEDVSCLKHPEIRPAAAILQATPYDFLPNQWRFPSFWKTMTGIAGAPYEKDPERYERLSLKNYVRQDNVPVFFIEAELEHLFPSDLTLKIVRAHREMGIPSQWKVYERMEHGFLFGLERPKQREAFEDLCKFLEGTLETPLS